MHEPHAVGVVNCVGDLGDQGCRFRERQRPSFEEVFQRDSFDEVRNDRGQPVERLHLVNRYDPRMPQLGCRPRLPVKAL
jgi:hypothetical protein